MTGLATTSALNAVKNEIPNVSNLVTKNIYIYYNANISDIEKRYFCGKSNFEDDGIQNYSVFQLIYSFFKRLVILIIFQHGNIKDFLMKC